MTQLLLILLGLFSNPSNSNTSDCDGAGTTTASAQQNAPDPGDTGGETGHPIPPRIIGG